MLINVNDADGNAVNGIRPSAAPSGSAVYVDTENLRDSDHARDIVAGVVANWPDAYPPMGSLSLYVRADKADLWRLWAETEYPGLQVRVRGVQHFSANSKAKNSADLAITADAVGDLIAGQAATVAVVSNDSDFGALFVKVRELAADNGVRDGGAPFLWITAPDAGLLSPEMEKFIPARYRWDLSGAGNGNGAALAIPAATAAPAAAAAPTVSKPAPKPLREAGRPAAALPAAPAPAAPAPAAATAGDNATQPGSDAIAGELLRQLPVGRFRVADAQNVIQRRWSGLPVAEHKASLGTYLLNEVWPILAEWGVEMPGRSSPRTYEITQAAKDAIAPAAPAATPAPPPDRSPPAATPSAAASEPTPQQLAAAVAAGIADDNFSASDAQAAIKARWPRYSPAAVVAQQFGVWFKNHLWPTMEQHGVAITREKPRRYEMTPDARHRIIALAPPGE